MRLSAFRDVILSLYSWTNNDNRTHNVYFGGVIVLSLAAYFLFWVVYNSVIGISVDMYYIFCILLLHSFLVVIVDLFSSFVSST